MFQSILFQEILPNRVKTHLARFPKNITITKFYATSVTPTGIAILKNAGFQDIGQIGKRIAFELDVMNSDARLAKQYRMMLRKDKVKTQSQPN